MNSYLPKRRDVTKFKFSESIEHPAKKFRIPINFTKSLQKLDIDIDCFELGVTDKEIMSFCQNLKKCASLQNIKLRFSGNEGITDVGVKHLGRTLQKLKSLEIAHLEFSSADLITTKGLDLFAKSLRKISSLRRLILNLQGCDQIGSKENQKISFHQYFRGMTSLKDLNLSFYACQQINDEKLKNIAEKLELLTFIKHLSLEFTSGRITDSGLSLLNQSLSKLSSLEGITLRFCW